MTIVESIKCVLQQNNDGLTSKQIYVDCFLYKEKVWDQDIDARSVPSSQ